MSGKKRFLCAVLGIVSLLTVFPCVVMMGSSLMGEGELKEVYGAVLGMGEDRAAMRILPKYLTLRGYAEILLDSPGFFVMFWNSVKQTACVLAGQMAVALPAAWAFARYRFRGRRALFITYVILMVLPFQVTMVSSYLVLDKLSLMDTHLAVILPGIFSTFPVFIMEKFFRAIPKTMIEAAEIDGAGPFQIFLKVGLPLGKPGIASCLILDFLECWNSLELPMTFLKTESKMPLSLYLPEITAARAGVSFAASVIMITPAVLVFLWGQEYLRQGIAVSGLKE